MDFFDVLKLLLIAFFIYGFASILFRIKSLAFKIAECKIEPGDTATLIVSSWFRVQGSIEKLAIKYHPPFTSVGSRGSYYLDASVSYEFNGKKRVCSASPYSLVSTEDKEQAEYLLRELLKERVVDVYVDPSNHDKSYFIYKGLRSWREIAPLHKLSNKEKN